MTASPRTSGLHPTHVIKKPLLSEKSTFAMNELARYSFLVDKRATKTDIKSAVEAIYSVKVESVNTQTSKGRYRRLKYGEIKAPDLKKAIVRLREGDRIELF
jgi:large subunit ribosomal protein L23